MEKRNLWFKADKGKHFILTQKGKDECASYKYGTVGEPIDDYETEAVGWAVESGYVEEVPIPNWTTLIGYKVMYMNGEYELSAGNGGEIFPTREIAQRYKEHYESYPWVNNECYIKVIEYEGIPLKPCREFNGKPVYNKDYCHIDALQIGDYVEPEIVGDILDCVPPACMRYDCSQCGEPSNHMIDEETGKARPTYCTFKRISKDVWEYCGNCFRGENVKRGKELPYVR